MCESVGGDGRGETDGGNDARPFVCGGATREEMSTSSPPSQFSDIEEEEKKKHFAAQFLRRRDVLALRRVVAEVRSMMERCRLPSIDAAMIEKYIIANVERCQQEMTTGRRPEAARRKSHCLQKKGNSSVECAQTSSPDVLLSSSSSYNLRSPLKKDFCDAGGAVSRVFPAGVLMFAAHSRHAALYASAYQSSLNGAKEEKQEGSAMSAPQRGMQTSSHVVKSQEVHSFSSRDQHSHHSHKRQQQEPIEDATLVGGAGTAGVCPSLLYDASVADLMQVHFVLCRHEARTLAVLNAIGRREVVMSKLRSFLEAAAEELCVAASSDLGGEGDEVPSSRGRRWKDPVATQTVCARQGHHPPPPPFSEGDRLGARRRYYRRGVFYILQKLQRASVDVVDAVQAWRQLLTDNYPFVVEGRHYFLRMLQEMADLSKEPALRALFPSAKRRSPGAPTGAAGGNDLVPADEYSFPFPESLQFCPLFSNMPNLMDYRRPPEPMVADDTHHFLTDGDDAGDSGVRGLFATRQKTSSGIRRHRGRVFRKKLSKDVAYFFHVCDAEAILNAEISVQLQLLRRNFIACAEGRRPLILRGVGELFGSRHRTVRFGSRQRQREWYWSLHDMLSCLEEGTSMVYKD